MKQPPHLAVDLFAGCGGLSLGLTQAGFDVRVAVEVDPKASATFRANHPTTIVLNRDIRHVRSSEILRHCDRPVALVTGCAPCQGFSSLTSKLRRDDPRNELLFEMTRLVRELMPHALMMENVPGLATRGASTFERFLRELGELGYHANWRVLQLADFGVPQSRRRLVLLAGKGFLIDFPRAAFAKSGRASGKRPWRSLAHAIKGLPAPLTLSQALTDGGPGRSNWHVVRDIQPQTAARLCAAVPGKTWLGIDEDTRPACHRGGYTGFTNVYGRMSWDLPSVTITGGCTTACKGRFGHPDPQRTTISVREAALIQTFPKRYKFASPHMDAVCEMIGNAVPPLFAKKVAHSIRRRLAIHESLAR